MFEVSAADPDWDPFAVARRPLNIYNCNIEPQFQETNTRTGTGRHLFEARKSALEKTMSVYIEEPPEDIPASDEGAIIADHLYRDFAPFDPPEPRGDIVPFMDPDNDFKPKPHWFCDLPSSAMRKEPKIYMNEAQNPVLNKDLPHCCSCNEPLEFPFMASLKDDICYNCLAAGRLPPRSTTLDFVKVEDPEGGVGWTLEETNKLITLVADRGDCWAEIAAEMKTRTPAECILHFLRIPMFDQYYIADPLAVPKGDIPTDTKIVPFMSAPDPISAYVEFMHSFDSRLGSAVADKAQERIQEILQSKSGVVLYENVGKIVVELMELTGERALELAVEDSGKMMGTFREILRILDNEVITNFHELEAGMNDIMSNMAASMGLS